MVKKLTNLSHITDNIIKNNIKLVGFGSFVYGCYNYWKELNKFIKQISKKKNKIDIFIEDAYPLIKNVNDVIHDKTKLKLDGDYRFNEEHPLKDYVRTRTYDSVEFLNFIKTLQDLNREGVEVNIFGVDALIQKNNVNLIIADEEDPKEVYDLYPSLKNKKSPLINFMKKKRWGIANRDIYMFDLIKELMEKRNNFSIFVGGNMAIQTFSLNGYKTAGYYLKKHLKDKYVALGTAAADGSVTYAGKLKPGVQRFNVKLYDTYEFYEKPKVIKHVDVSSLKRDIQNRYANGNTLYIEVQKEGDLFYFTSGEIQFDPESEVNYSDVKDLDYLIYFMECLPTHNIILDK